MKVECLYLGDSVWVKREHGCLFIGLGRSHDIEGDWVEEDVEINPSFCLLSETMEQLIKFYQGKNPPKGKTEEELKAEAAILAQWKKELAHG